MFRVDANNQIFRLSDGKQIVKDITSTDYQFFVYIQANGQDPTTKQISRITYQNNH